MGLVILLEFFLNFPTRRRPNNSVGAERVSGAPAVLNHPENLSQESGERNSDGNRMGFEWGLFFDRGGK